MFYLHLRTRQAHMFAALSLGVVLVGCQPPSSTTTSAAQTPAAVVSATAIPPAATPVAPSSAVVATPMVILPTAVPPKVAASVQPTPLLVAPPPTLAMPTALPTSSPLPLPRTADRLPSDQPWLFVSEGSGICGAQIGALSLIAVDPAGKQTRLKRGVTAIAKRPGMPPLLVTCAADSSVAIIDPLHWASVPLALPPGVTIAQIVLSPDGKQAILQLDCVPYDRCPANPPAMMQIANLQTGALHPFPGAPPLFSPVGTGPPPEPVRVELLGWGNKGLYSTTTIFYKIPISRFNLVDPAAPQASSPTLAQDSRYLVDSAHDRVLVVSSNDTSLTLYDMRQQTTQTIEQSTMMPASPVLAPDGTALAYFRAHSVNNGQSQQTELVVFDITHSTKTVLVDSLGEPNNLLWDSALAWSQDSQRIIASTRSAQGVPQASLLTRDGALLNTVPVVDGQELGITSDDQLVLALQDGQVISWLPLRAGAAPYRPNMLAGGAIISAFLPPLSASAPPIAPTNAIALAVTQLPTPVAPTPTPALPATLAPIAKLGNLADDVRPYSGLYSGYPMSDYMLYSTRGSLYSQSLHGGPAQALSDATQPLPNVITTSSDGETLIYSEPDRLYRVPLAGGARVRLSAPLSGDSETGILYAGLTADGRQVVYEVIGPIPAAWKDQLRDDTRWVVALYSVPLTGGTPLRLTPPLDPDSEIAGFILTTDNRQVIYWVDVPDPASVQSDLKIQMRTIRMYKVPITGGAPLQLVNSASTSMSIWSQTLINDQYLLYLELGSGTYWSVPLAGGPPVKLDGPDGMSGGYQLSADNRWALYQGAAGFYSVPTAGGTAVNLTGSVSLGHDLHGALFTPDGAHVIFQTDSALYSVPISGGPATSLSRLTHAAGMQEQYDFAFGDGRVVYKDDNALFSVALSGGTPTRLTPPTNQSAKLILNRLGIESRYVVYQIEQGTEPTRASYSVPITGGSPAPLLVSPLETGTGYAISAGYAIGLAADGRLYAAPLAGGPALQLSSMGIDRSSLLISTDGHQISYIARFPADPIGNALYVATLP